MPVKAPDQLVPSFDSPERHSTTVVATFNLVATIVGGGVLSLPYAFSKCGILLATILMIFAALITDRSLYLLCLCARRTGSHTYGEVGKAAFGPWMETTVSGLLFVFLLFVLVAYMVLVRDIWTPIVGLVIPQVEGTLVVSAMILVMSPFLIQKTLYELRFNCYVAFGAVSILCCALCHRAIQKVLSGDLDSENIINISTSHPGDALFAFPIITLSFLSSFNVLPIQSALIQPTRARVSCVINGAVWACFGLMYLFGLTGYLYAGGAVEGNILLNCDHTADILILMGQIGCGITLMLAMAMITLPCRDSLLEVIDTFVPGKEHHESREMNAEMCVTELTRSTYSASVKSRVAHEETPLLPDILEQEESCERFNVFDDPYVHYGATFGIVVLCLAGATAAPSVATVWSICGSSMAFVISFLLPGACYLKIDHQHHTIWGWFSWFLVLFSVIGSIVCTIQTILGFFHST